MNDEHNLNTVKEVTNAQSWETNAFKKITSICSILPAQIISKIVKGGIKISKTYEWMMR